jgi:hypothetical protein
MSTVELDWKLQSSYRRPHGVSTLASVVCSLCGSPYVAHSRIRWWEHPLLIVTSRRPYRCLKCRRRRWRRRDPSGAQVLLAICLMVSAGLVAHAAVPSEQAHKSSARRAAKTPPPARTQSTFTTALRDRLSQAVPLQAVRYLPSGGVLRIVTDASILKEPLYRQILPITCGEILRARMLQTIASIEVLNAQQQQGYVYRAVWKCADVATAAPERLKLLVLADTRVKGKS